MRETTWKARAAAAWCCLLTALALALAPAPAQALTVGGLTAVKTEEGFPVKTLVKENHLGCYIDLASLRDFDNVIASSIKCTGGCHYDPNRLYQSTADAYGNYYHTIYMDESSTSGTYKFRVKNACELLDGTKVDIVLSFSVAITGKIDYSQEYKRCVYAFEVAEMQSPRKDVNGNSIGTTQTCKVNLYEANAAHDSTVPVDAAFAVQFRDLDAANHVADDVNPPYSGDYAEGVELVSKYGTGGSGSGKLYYGKAVARADHIDSDGNQPSDSGELNLGTRSGNPWIYSSHSCNGMTDSCFAVVATNGFEFTWRGSKACGTKLGIAADIDTGKLNVKKARHANASWAGALDTYSLSGAKYGVYADQACTDELAELATGSTGASTKTVRLAVGDYWVKEKSASKGYALDTTVHKVTVRDGETSTVNSTETPKNTANPLLVVKTDSETGEALAGAEFTVSYYDAYYSSASALSGKTPEKTWVVKTGSDGKAVLDAAHKVSGDDYYANTGGRATLPLGTVTVTETKAPAGHTLTAADGSSPKVFISKVEETSGTTEASAKLSSVNHAANRNSDGVPEVDDPKARGDLRLNKADADWAGMAGGAPAGSWASSPAPQGDGTLAGAEIEVYNATGRAVLSPLDGTTEVANGKLVCVVKTDASGYAATNAPSANGWSRPSKWAGALEAGKYTLKEKTPPEGYRKNTSWRGQATIPDDGGVVWVTTS